jgi:hypothetical protein
MEQTYWRDLGDYVKRYYGWILLSAAVLALCFGYMVFCGNIRIDTEELLNNPGTTVGWLTIGRYSLVLFKYILGLTTHSVWKSGMFFFLFFFIGMHFLAAGCYHFSEEKNDSIWAFLLLYATSNIWSFQIYFSLQQAEVALAMLLLVLAGIMMTEAAFLGRGKWNVLRVLCSLVFLVLGLGAYQALASYYIAVCIVFFLILRKNAECTTQRTAAGIGKLLVHFLAAFLIHTFIAQTWFMTAGGYVSEQMGWGKYSIQECMKNILRTMKNAVVSYGPRNFSFYTVGVLLLAVLVVLIIKEKRYLSVGNLALWLVALAALLITPFLMTAAMGEMLVTRSQFALPVVAAFLGMYVPDFFQNGWNRQKVGIVICRVLVVLVIIGQTAYDISLSYTDYVRYEWDKQQTKELYAALVEANQGEVPEQPVIFVGYRKPELDFWCARTEMFGWSFYEWDYGTENPTGVTHRAVGLVQAYIGEKLNEDCTDEEKNRAVEMAEQMTAYPQEGSILAEEDLIVVKLSDVTERTDINWW